MTNTPPRNLNGRDTKIYFCLISVIFFLTLPNKRNKVSGTYDRRPQQGGANVGVCPGRTT